MNSMEFNFPPFVDVGVPLFVAFDIACGAIRDAEHEQRCFGSALDASSHGFLFAGGSRALEELA